MNEKMIFQKLICFLFGHKWHNYPEISSLPDFKVCERCKVKTPLTPYLTRGEVEYINKMFIDALNCNLIARKIFTDEKEVQVLDK